MRLRKRSAALVKTTRKFDGKNYTWRSATSVKERAKGMAEQFRRMGKSARIVKANTMYQIYVRG